MYNYSIKYKEMEVANVGEYYIYLRKSRADIELEKANRLDTLERHEKTLRELANNMKIDIKESHILREVVSGESIVARPKMQELLSIVETGTCPGILVMEIERLARGNTIDQGIVAQTFQYTGTKIITPTKIYDPSNEFDQEYFEFGLFMSRREYKAISRRLIAGRERSVKDGRYIGSITPFGYDKEKIKGAKGYKLIINEKQAKIVKLIFELFVSGKGTTIIANRLNSLGYKPQKNDIWTAACIRNILLNPVYMGKLKWNGRRTIKRFENGKIRISRPIATNYILSDGLHDSIIDEEQFREAQNRLKSNSREKVKRNLHLCNPFAGLIKCGVCGRSMIRRPYMSGYKDGLICSLSGCNNVSSHLYLVEERAIEGLKLRLKDYKKIVKDYESNKDTVVRVKTEEELFDEETKKINLQLNTAYELVEQGIYTRDLFLQRKEELEKRLECIKKEKDEYLNSCADNKINEIKKLIPKIENCLTYYDNMSIEDKHDLLKDIVSEMKYFKSKGGRGYEDCFELQIKLRI